MKTTVYIGTSLDGFIARKDGDIEWLVQYANEEAIHAYEEFMGRTDAIVMGRGTFEKVLGFPSWPYDKKVFVLSTTIKQMPDAAKDRATVLSMKPDEVLNYLAQLGFSRIYIDGGKVIQEFLKEDLIDELIISKTPSLIGSGIPLFGYLENDLQFRHIRTEVQSNELVRSYYERKPKVKEYLFSYGTLQKEKVQLDLFGRILKGSPDTLKGYRVMSVEITDEAFLSRGEQKHQQTVMVSNDKNDSINGSAFEMTTEELLLADSYEPGNYKRMKITLESGKEAWIYAAVDASPLD